jgi:hypothetical protein
VESARGSANSRQGRRAAAGDAPVALALLEVESSAVGEPLGAGVEDEAGMVPYLDMASWMRAVAGAGEDGELERHAVGEL